MTPSQKNPPAADKQPDRSKQLGNKPAAAPGGCQALTYEPGVSPGSVDVTGIVPEGVHVDPNSTEGHPGYDESGPSEIVLREPIRGEVTPE